MAQPLTERFTIERGAVVAPEVGSPVAALRRIPADGQVPPGHRGVVASPDGITGLRLPQSMRYACWVHCRT